MHPSQVALPRARTDRFLLVHHEPLGVGLPRGQGSVTHRSGSGTVPRARQSSRARTEC